MIKPWYVRLFELLLLPLPVPGIAILGVLLYGFLWHTQRVDQKVTAARDGYVLESAKAAEEANRLAAERERDFMADLYNKARARADGVENAYTKLAQRFAETALRSQNQEDQINELLSKPPADGCVVDQRFLDLLMRKR